MFQSKAWGVLPDGRQADLITLKSPAGAVAEISNFGGIIRSLRIPLADGMMRETVLGYDSPAEYAKDGCCVGVLVGPVANRISNARFSLEGASYGLEANSGQSCLHSGKAGWQHKLFDYEREGDSLVLSYHRPDGEGGFPGNLRVKVRFSWKSGTALSLAFEAETDKATVMNMTHHSYFNLGAGDTVLSHRLRINAKSYTPADGELLPTGEILPVAGTPYDFTLIREIGGAYDINFVLCPESPAAVLESPDRKLRMNVITDKPGLQLYTGTSLEGKFPPFGGVCLETQHFPDAVNIPGFPSPVIRPGELYSYTTEFIFENGSF